MSTLALAALRKANGWSQVEAARHLRVSQPYLSLLESGARPVSPRLRRRLLKVYGAPPTVLPLSRSLAEWPRFSNEVFSRHLSALGYPPFGYVDPHPQPENPAALLLWALGAPDLEARLAEALPWLLLAFADLDTTWLVREAKLNDLQNRLGFLTTLAQDLALTHPRFAHRAQDLAQLLATLEPSRLAREDTLFEPPMSQSTREMLRRLQTPAAAHWNVLTYWKAEHLNYDF